MPRRQRGADSRGKTECSRFVRRVSSFRSLPPRGGRATKLIGTHRYLVMISIHYALKGAGGLRMVATLDAALDQACRLLSAGAEVFEIAQRG